MPSRATTAMLDRRVLDSMVRGTVYGTREIAMANDMAMSGTRHVLVRLARSGAVERIEPALRGLPVEWRRVG